MKTIIQEIGDALQNPGTYFIMILLVAFAAGIHGLVVLYKLNRQSRQIRLDERFWLAIFNVVISLASVFGILVMMQINTDVIIRQAGELLAQLK